MSSPAAQVSYDFAAPWSFTPVKRFSQRLAMPFESPLKGRDRLTEVNVPE